MDVFPAPVKCSVGMRGLRIEDRGRRSCRPDTLVVVALFTAFVLAPLAGCTNSAWTAALEQDSPATYIRFMREHPDSPHVDEAKSRVDFHKLKRNPTLAGYEAFREKYPESPLLEEMRPMIEGPAFAAAHAMGTAEAYDGFLERFPAGQFSDRARGNAIYVRERGFGGDPEALGAFADEHPESDYAAEAARTRDSWALRDRTAFDGVGLVVRLSPSVPEAGRLRKRFIEIAKEQYERADVPIVLVPDLLGAEEPEGLPQARLEIEHGEEAVESDLSADGQLGRPGWLATTRVVLRERADAEPISDRTFRLKIDSRTHIDGYSVLSTTGAKDYWNELHVPIAHWRNNESIRPRLSLESPPVDVDAAGARAAVLYEGGDVEILSLADPTKPEVLGRYERPKDFRRWSGIRVFGARVVIYGEEGLELIEFGSEGPRAVFRRGRDDIGGVFDVAPLGESLVLAGAKGLMLLDPAAGENGLRRLMNRAVPTVATLDDTIVFCDKEAVFVTTLALLEKNRVSAQLKLGTTFGPDHVRIEADTAIVTGPGGALVVDLADVDKPKVISKLTSRQVGRVRDATRLRSRLFLVGDRGLLMLSRDGRRVEETVDVGPRARLVVMGRHLVTLADDGLQVVDSTPFTEPREVAGRTAKGAPAAATTR